MPEIPFPKANVTRIRWMDLQELVSIARDAGQELLRAHRSLVPPSGDGNTPTPMPTLVRKAVYSLRGGRPFALEAATAAAQKVLTRRLEQLNAEIPVVSRQAHAIAASERGRWNHFWVIDPLDGEAGFGTASGDFTVNLALIEDQKPVVGVVHAPVSGMTYYAMIGKGAFKSIGDQVATRLGAAGEASAVPTVPAGRAPSSTALSLCQLVESGGWSAAEIVDSMEWQSAAPHAIARLIGRRVVAADSAVELTYNKVDWSNPCIRIA